MTAIYPTPPDTGRRENVVVEARSVLYDLPLVKLLPAELRRLVVDSVTPERFSFGSTVVREGDEADAFYVMVTGRARVLKQGQNGEELSLSILRAGQSFGEMALLEYGRRGATVRASSDVEVLKLNGSVFQAL